MTAAHRPEPPPGCGGVNMPSASLRPKPTTAMGPVELSVRRDLDKLTNSHGVQDTLKQMAIGLAASIDSWGTSVTAAAQLNALAKAHQELRATLNQILKGSDGGQDQRTLQEQMSKAE